MDPWTKSSCIHDPPGYISPYLQDFLLTDITGQQLLNIAYLLEVEYLSPATAFPGSFPAQGAILGLNNRLMINLVCRKRGNTDAINVIFLINTGSSVSYLSEKAMRALSGNRNTESKVNQIMDVIVHSDCVTMFYLSPPDKHFADVNVLGTDFLSHNKLSISINYTKNSFELIN
jgi:hypothetical protein